MTSRPRVRLALGVLALCASSLGAVEAFQTRRAWPPMARKTPDKAPALTAQQELATIV